MKKRIIQILFIGLITTTASSCNKQEQDEKINESKIVNNKKGKVMENLTKESFKEKVFNFEQNQEWEFEGDLPCIIDFYADWCGPCKMLAPVLEELAKEYDGKINIYKIDTEKEQELAAMFGIKSIPSILFCPKGEKPQMANGALPKESFVSAINDILLNNIVTK